MTGAQRLAGAKQPWHENPLVRGFLVFSAFRAVYGIGILIVTYGLATGTTLPWWTSLVFLGCSMVFSRWLFRKIKQRWPALMGPADPLVSA